MIVFITLLYVKQQKQQWQCFESTTVTSSHAFLLHSNCSFISVQEPFLAQTKVDLATEVQGVFTGRTETIIIG